MMKQSTLFTIKALEPVSNALTGFVRINHDAKHIKLFSELYAKQSQALYNQSKIYPFSYLNTGQLELYINEDAFESGEIIPVVKKYKNAPRFFIHCPSAPIERILETVEQLSKESVKPVYISDVTDDFAKEFLSKTAEWKEHKTSDDVVYNAELIHNLKGKKYAKIRNTLKKVRENNNLRIEMIQTEKHRDDAISVFKEWKDTQGLKYFRVTVGRDVRLIEEYWNKIDMKNHFSFIAYIDDKPCGVSYGCRHDLNEEWGVEVTLKALPSAYGLSDYIRQHLISTMYQSGIKFINDSDLNYGTGVKKNKMKWKPIEFIKTFDLKKI